jgi:hypothetical protein
MKVLCYRCHIEKDCSEFGKDSSKKRGFSAFCHTCLKAYRKEYVKKTYIHAKDRVDGVERIKLGKKPNTYNLKIESRTCTKCNIVKDSCEFHKKKTGSYGIDTICVICKNAYGREYAKKRCKKAIKNGWLKSHYNITLEDYNKLLKMQNNCCAICSLNQSENKKAFAVDHNHKTGKVRGLLCSLCNQGIGFLKDDIKILKRAMKYLKFYDGD